MEYLFAYGTLQKNDIQQMVFGRKLIGEKKYLTQYKLDTIVIQNIIYPIIKFTNSNEDKIGGSLFEVSITDLLKADEYETNAYKRIKVKLLCEKECWVYVANN